MRVSNIVAIVLLLLTGYPFGRCAALRPWRTGVAMVIVGAVMVAITIALGGLRRCGRGKSVAAMFVLVASNVLAQASTTELSIAAMTNTSSVVETPAAKDWAFSAYVYTYLVPDDQNFAQPTITADRHWLHLEARYNYENLETGSLWVGYNCSVGDKLSLDFTPMLGGVFGRTTGIAPGYEFTLSLVETRTPHRRRVCVRHGRFGRKLFYQWSELSLSPMDWFRVGLVVQRTKVYQTALDVQRGLLAGFTYKRVNFTGYLLNPDEDNPTVVLALGVNF